MSLMFRKRIRIAKGVYLNIGKKGVSASVGVPGARVTLGKDRVTTSAGIPGTGLYDRTTHKVTRQASDPARSEAPSGGGLAIVGLLIVAALIFGAWLISRV